MSKTVLAYITIMCLLSTVFQMGCRISVKASPEHPVHNMDTGLNYATIQEAIDSTETLDGHTIHVDAGTYYENVVVHKTLSLIGDNRTSIIIDGRGRDNVVYVKANNVVISGFTVQNGNRGIWLFYSQNCTISGNNANDNAYGIELYHSSSSTIRGNNVTNNESFGIVLYYSGGCTVQNNTLVDNNFNFGVDGATLQDFVNDIDTSNTVNGKPIYYLLNQGDLRIAPSLTLEIGYLAFVNSTSIIVRDVTLTGNAQGILFAYTSDSTIKNVNTAHNWNGIYLKGSSNCQVSKNNADNNFDYGIALRLCRNCTVSRNNVTNNTWGGISFGSSCNCTAVGNNVTNSYYGIHLVDTTACVVPGNSVNKNIDYSIVIYRSYDNLIYHNNFVNYLIHAYGRSDNVWDNKIEGNYWSTYSGADADQDGIGDTSYMIDENNQDNCPLMGTYLNFNATSQHHLSIISNSTISGFLFNYTTICFNVTGKDGTTGFCRIYIPTALMNGTHKVFVNGTEVPHTLLQCSNSTHNYLYFTYDHSTQEVVIIREFQSLFILALLMIATLLTVILYGRKHSFVDTRVH